MIEAYLNSHPSVLHTVNFCKFLRQRPAISALKIYSISKWDIPKQSTCAHDFAVPKARRHQKTLLTRHRLPPAVCPAGTLPRGAAEGQEGLPPPPLPAGRHRVRERFRQIQLGLGSLYKLYWEKDKSRYIILSE